MNEIKKIIELEKTKKYSAKEIAEIMFDNKSLFGTVDWKTPEWFDIFPSLDKKLVEMAVGYLHENKKVEIYTVYPFRFIFNPKCFESEQIQLKLPTLQKDDRERHCKINDISKTLFKDKDDYNQKFLKLSPIENSIVVHWRSHPESKSYFDVSAVSMWAGCSEKIAEDMLNALTRKGFIKKVDDTQFKTTDINYAIHGI